MNLYYPVDVHAIEKLKIVFSVISVVDKSTSFAFAHGVKYYNLKQY